MKIDEYALGRSEAETRRLMVQDQIYGPITRRFFQTAGIGPGMKVLDIGSGAGDVALLVAGLVGPTGRVVGVEMNESILDTARARVATAGWSNVTFLAGEAGKIPLDSDFDAVVGRWVLMWVKDPVALIRQLVKRLRVGGIVAFHENDFSYPPSVFPPTDLWRKVQGWMVPPPGTPGPEMQMGTKLFRAYIEAGLPEPQLLVEAPVGGGREWPGYGYVVETFRSLMPAIQARTGLDPGEVDIDTLADRLRDDVTRQNGIQMLPLMFGAWSRRRQ